MSRILFVTKGQYEANMLQRTLRGTQHHMAVSPGAPLTGSCFDEVYMCFDREELPPAGKEWLEIAVHTRLKPGGKFFE